MATSPDLMEYESLHYPSFDWVDIFSQNGGTILQTPEGRNSPKRGLHKNHKHECLFLSSNISPKKPPKGPPKISHSLPPKGFN
jgi:hypothetical protein